jgi:putative endonuclease
MREMKNRKETGNLGEKLARDFLKKKGYKIVETNYRCADGEMDIIAKQKDCLVFVEVRTKTGTGSAVRKSQLRPPNGPI